MTSVRSVFFVLSSCYSWNGDCVPDNRYLVVSNQKMLYLFVVGYSMIRCIFVSVFFGGVLFLIFIVVYSVWFCLFLYSYYFCFAFFIPGFFLVQLVY